ncbi:MAG: ATP-binding protein [Gallionellaceae bacterium]|nr:ATP-binding protein [Gallionellaceae bacterium]
MKRWLPDTVFTRLFGLTLGAVLVSHLVIALLLFGFADHRGPPPGAWPPPHEMFKPGYPPPPPHMAQLGLPPMFWLGLAVQFLAVAAAVWFGARLMARPIQDLAEAASRLGRNVNAPPVVETGPDEARAAARVFNHMQERIHAQINERSRFLAAVSHDLRTPLTRIKLRIEQPLDDKIREKSRGDVAEMAAMLDATLDYLRGANRSEAWRRLDVQALVEAMAEDARENGHAVNVSGQARPLMAQPNTLRRCIDNLIENAVRFGEQADISLIETPDCLVIEILDNGPGIPENRMASVFEPFVRLEDSRNRNTGGVGLGLATARDVARAHGGELVLQNLPEGGLLAKLTLPRQP